MGQIYLFLCGLVLFTCLVLPIVETPQNMLVNNFDLNLKHSPDGWFYKQKQFNGYMVERDRDGTILYKLPIVNGKEDGKAFGWFNTGEKMMARNFENGLKKGTYEQWWPNGHYRYLFHYVADVLDGRQMVFYADGKKRQESNYLMGNLEGVQRSWDHNGVLISNYTIKNGKLFGVIKVKSCMPHGH